MTQTKINTRSEKIKLLNDLKTGKANINEVFPELPEHWVFEKSRGIYSRGDQELNEGGFMVMKKRKGKDWLFNIWKLNDIIGGEGKIVETVSNCENFEWPKYGPPPLDEKQLDKICSALNNYKKI